MERQETWSVVIPALVRLQGLQCPAAAPAAGALRVRRPPEQLQQALRRRKARCALTPLPLPPPAPQSEAANIGATVASALAGGSPPCEVLVVDGGSSDGTQQAARKAGAKVGSTAAP